MRVEAAAALAAGLTLLAAACGSSAPAPPPGSVTLTPQERRGKVLFTRHCGACHTLADAGTKGIAGPDFDAHPWRAVTVGESIASGPGVMPAGLLAGPAADAVAAYVAAVTRR